MEIFLNLISVIQQAILSFYNSNVFLAIKIIIGIYVTVLFVDIVLMLFQRGVTGDLLDTTLGLNMPKELATKKKKLKLKWEKIVKRLESENESEYKVAIIEADNLIDDLIARLGYSGNNMRERLENIVPGQIDNIEKIKEAHEVRNKVIQEEGLSISREEAKKVLDDFAELLRFFDVID